MRYSLAEKILINDLKMIKPSTPEIYKQIKSLEHDLCTRKIYLSDIRTLSIENKMDVYKSVIIKTKYMLSMLNNDNETEQIYQKIISEYTREITEYKNKYPERFI